MQIPSSWEQQPGEKDYVYEAACIYFEMGPGRSLKAVAARCQRHPATLAKWSAQYRWVARARAYDGYRLQREDEQRQRVLEAANQTEAQQWRERLLWKREQEWETSQALLAKAREMLACPLEDAKWNWRDAAALIHQAARLVQMAADAGSEQAADAGDELTVRVEYVDREAGQHDEDE